MSSLPLNYHLHPNFSLFDMLNWFIKKKKKIKDYLEKIFVEWVLCTGTDKMLIRDNFYTHDIILSIQVYKTLNSSQTHMKPNLQR